MATIRCMTFENWGMDSFCIQDYTDYLEDMGAGTINSDEKIASITLYDEDDYITLSHFVRLAKDARHVTLFVIEFAFIKDREKAKQYWNKIKTEVEESGDYIDLESYETKLAFGLRGDRR